MKGLHLKDKSAGAQDGAAPAHTARGGAAGGCSVSSDAGLMSLVVTRRMRLWMKADDINFLWRLA